MKRATLMVIVPLALMGASSRPSGASWHSCGGDSGGAFNTRVAGLSCGYAARVTEAGLRPDLRSTRLGHLACTRRPDGAQWSYRCVRAGGREQVRFNTF